jgi:hypothetical protein
MTIIISHYPAASARLLALQTRAVQSHTGGTSMSLGPNLANVQSQPFWQRRQHSTTQQINFECAWWKLAQYLVE